MTNRFNKHDFIENQAKLDIFDNFFDMQTNKKYHFLQPW